MINWEKNQLAELVDVRVSNVDKKIYPHKKLVFLCNYMDAYRNNYISKRISYSIGSADLNEINRFSLINDDVVITKDSETPDDIAIPTVVIENIPNLICGYHLAILRPKKEKISGRFLMHKMNLPDMQKYFFRMASGSTRYGLTIGGIESAIITHPSLSHQRKIARILTTVDNIIEKTEAVIAKYKAIKQGMMHDLFTRGIDVKTGKLRPEYEDAPELYKESKLGWIPKEWEELKFADVCIVNQGLQISISNRFKAEGENRYVYITIQYLNNTEDESNQFYIESPPASVICYEEDILMTRTGNTGRVVTNIVGVFHNNFFKVDYKRDNNKKFIIDHLKRPEIQKLIMNYAGTTTIPDLKHSDFYKLPFFKPMNREQKIIVNKIDSIDNKIRYEYNYLCKIKVLKTGLMQDLLTGKKEVTPDSEDYKDLEK